MCIQKITKLKYKVNTSRKEQDQYPEFLFICEKIEVFLLRARLIQSHNECAGTAIVFFSLTIMGYIYNSLEIKMNLFIDSAHFNFSGCRSVPAYMYAVNVSVSLHVYFLMPVIFLSSAPSYRKHLCSERTQQEQSTKPL